MAFVMRLIHVAFLIETCGSANGSSGLLIAAKSRHDGAGEDLEVPVSDKVDRIERHDGYDFFVFEGVAVMLFENGEHALH
ncbi:hypothetical protein [Thermosulfurimonas sp. F29]|uniref:hypothetical protein n=1 Tax=Thermosulfurimonas sp. F29 TaxID=2867247 RepID=UPI001C83018B|nr:hypothetical protein [Thermosulfurimonas sp. F29]MBX6424100.1 hypothetical protein [Thermosulfurimonas sp. F29]